jgi:hypothetical protein
MLAVATGWTLEYIDSLPMSEFNNMMALNYIDPYTHDVQSRREGLLITETFNARRKKQLKVHEMFPYMSDGNPDWISDNTVELAKELILRHRTGCESRNQTPDYAYVKPLIKEEIAIEISKPDHDVYKVKQLKQLLGNITNG